MTADVVFLPKDLEPRHREGRVVVVFDVLRATTSMTAALACGVREIRVYGSIDAVRAVVREPGMLLCGEEKCLPPLGFDLGNSPGAFCAERHAGATLLMSTTNGTRAMLAARGAAAMFVGALVNARAVAKAVRETGLDSCTLLCAGTDGQIAMEDLLGAGAVLDHLIETGGCDIASDAAHVALQTFLACRGDLPAMLRKTRGGHNVEAAGLGTDIDFAARWNALDAVGVVDQGEPLIVRRQCVR